MTPKGNETLKYYRYFEKDLGKLCRSCLNQKHNLTLRREDCGYGDYLAECRRCKKVKNIVHWINFRKRLPMMLRSAPRS